MTAYAARPDVDLSVEVTVEGTPRAGLLTVAWTLANTGHDPLLVVDRVPRASGASVAWDPRTAYVVGGGDGLVQVASRLFPLPETDRMSWARAPRVGGEPQPAWGLERADGFVLLAHGGGAVAAQHVLCSDPVPLG